MSETNGTLAHSLSEARQQARLSRLRLEQARADHERRQLESFLGPGLSWNPQLDAFRFGWNVGGPGVWLPPGFGGRAADRKDGVNRPFIWTEQHLEWMRGQAAVLEAENDVAKGVLRSLTNYTVKVGYTWEAVPTDPTDRVACALAKQVQKVVDEFNDINLCGQVERDQFYWSRVDGESIVRFFAEPDGCTLVRPVESCQLRTPPGAGPEWTFGYRTHPRDCLTFEEFALTYQADRPDDVEYVDAEDVAFLKLNVRPTVKRGLSDFYSSGESLRQSEQLLRTLTTVGHIQAKVPWIEQYNGLNKTALLAAIAAKRAQNLPQVADALTGREPSYQQLVTGEIPHVGEGKEYIPQPSAGNAPNHIQVVQARLRSLGARWGMPEFLISGDASNNNYASIFVSGGPWVQAVECEQVVPYLPHFLRWRWVAVRNAARAGLLVVGGHRFTSEEVQRLVDIVGTPPQVAISNKAEEATVDHQDLEARVISPQHRQAKLGVKADKIAADWREVDGSKAQPQKDGRAAPSGGPQGADDDQSDAASENNLRATVGGSQAVAALQRDYYDGKLPREAAIANAVVVFGFTDREADRLFPQVAPQKLTPDDAPKGTGEPGNPLAQAVAEALVKMGLLREVKDASGHEHAADGKFGTGGGTATTTDDAVDPADALAEHGISGALTPEHEAALDEKAGGFLSKMAALPGKLIPARVKAAAARVKEAVVGALKKRYGEKATGLILKAAAISAPIPVPGSQPLTIAVSLVVAEAVRAFQKLRGTAAPATEGVEGSMTADELADAAREFMADLSRQLQAELGLTEGKTDDHDLGDPDERAALMAEVFYGLFGDKALGLLAQGNADEPEDASADVEESLARAALRVLLEGWSALDHPRGPNGRFIPKGSAEAQSAAKEAIGNVLKGGEHTPEQAERVLEHLNILRVDQLKELHREHGQAIPGRLRAQLVEGIKARLEASTKKADRPVKGGGSAEHDAVIQQAFGYKPRADVPDDVRAELADVARQRLAAEKEIDAADLARNAPPNSQEWRDATERGSQARERFNALGKKADEIVNRYRSSRGAGIAEKPAAKPPAPAVEKPAATPAPAAAKAASEFSDYARKNADPEHADAIAAAMERQAAMPEEERTAHVARMEKEAKKAKTVTPAVIEAAAAALHRQRANEAATAERRGRLDAAAKRQSDIFKVAVDPSAATTPQQKEYADAHQALKAHLEAGGDVLFHNNVRGKVYRMNSSNIHFDEETGAVLVPESPRSRKLVSLDPATVVNMASGLQPAAARGKPADPAEHQNSILRSMAAVESDADTGALVSVKELRAHSGMDKASFDAAVGKMINDGTLSGHRNNFPDMMTPEQKADAVEMDGDYWIGLAVRAGDAKSEGAFRAAQQPAPAQPRTPADIEKERADVSAELERIERKSAARGHVGVEPASRERHAELTKRHAELRAELARAKKAGATPRPAPKADKDAVKAHVKDALGKIDPSDVRTGLDYVSITSIMRATGADKQTVHDALNDLRREGVGTFAQESDRSQLSDEEIDNEIQHVGSGYTHGIRPHDPTQDDEHFTGTDRLGRQWSKGKLAKPGAAPAARATPGAAPAARATPQQVEQTIHATLARLEAKNRSTGAPVAVWDLADAVTAAHPELSAKDVHAHLARLQAADALHLDSLNTTPADHWHPARAAEAMPHTGPPRASGHVAPYAWVRSKADGAGHGFAPEPAAKPDALDAFHKLNQSGDNRVSLADLHQALGHSDLAQTHAAVNDLRKAGVLVASSFEGRHGSSDPKDKRDLDHAIRTPGTEEVLSHVALTPDWQEALARHRKGKGR